MGIGKRETKRKDGKVTHSRTYTIYVDTGQIYPNGRKKYKQIKRSLGTTAEVPKAAAKAEYEKAASKYKSKKYVDTHPTLGTFSPRYITHKRYAEGKKSWERDRYSLNRLVPYFGPDTLLSDIGPKDIDRYKKDRQRQASKKTVNIELECFRNMFNLAISWGEYDGDNPVRLAGLIKKIVRNKRKPPTPDEETLLLSRLNPSIYRIAVFAANTGMRITEVVELDTDQFTTVSYIENGQVKTIELVVLHATDTKDSEERIIPLNADAQRAKNEALAYNNGRYKRLFLNTRGLPYTSRHAVYWAFKRACKSLGIRRITPHDLRRLFASLVIENGGNILDTRDMMGHASYKMLAAYVTTNLSKIRAVKAIERKGTIRKKSIVS